MMNRLVFAATLLAAVIGASVAAAAEETCGPQRLVAGVDLVPDSDGAAKFVPVTIGGTPRLMILDTGAQVSVITGKVADELKLSRQKSSFEMRFLTGATIDSYVKVPVVLGGLKGDLKLWVADVLNQRYSDSRIAGLLGIDILANFDVSIDYGTNRLDLIDKNHCAGKVIYWPATVAAVVPFTLKGAGTIVFNVVLDGVKIGAKIDTGASRSTLRRNAAQRLFGLELGSEDTPEIGGLNERADLKTYKHTFKSLSFDGVSVSNPTFHLIADLANDYTALGNGSASHIPEHDEAAEADILIGRSLLKHLHLYIAYKEKKLYITPATPAAPPPPK